MPEQDYSLGALDRWTAYYVGKGQTLPQIQAKAITRFGTIDPAMIEASYVRAVNIVTRSKNWNLLQPDKPLRSILGDTEPPADSTYINFKAPLNAIDKQGNVIGQQWREIQWRGGWDITKAEIMQMVNERASEIVRNTPAPPAVGWNVGDIVLDSTIWFPHPQQL